MKVEYTRKLFYKKYAYKVVLTCQTPGPRWGHVDNPPAEFDQLDAWCEAHAPGAHKIQRRYQGANVSHTDWHQHVYLLSAHVKDALLLTYGAQVTTVWQPLDADHLQRLDARNVVEVRKQLIYGKYDHAIYFKYDRDGVTHTWLKQLLTGNKQSKLAGCKWWPIVYSADIADVHMIALSYPERIDYIKHVKLLPP